MGKFYSGTPNSLFPIMAIGEVEWDNGTQKEVVLFWSMSTKDKETHV